jgi:hypothetical protein
MKELEILKLHGQGYSYRQIARGPGIQGTKCGDFVGLEHLY